MQSAVSNVATIPAFLEIKKNNFHDMQCCSANNYYVVVLLAIDIQ